jgi:hypothetical protein
VGHSLLGVQAELGYYQCSVFLAATAAPRFSFGGRWSPDPSGAGFGVALQGLVWSDYSTADRTQETVVVVAATAHYRFRWGLFLADVGAGPAVSFDSYRLLGLDAATNLRRNVCFGVRTGVGKCEIPLDVEVSVGVGF